MKVVGITILRTGSSLTDPIPLCMACDLSSYGFFQRQVSEIEEEGGKMTTEVRPMIDGNIMTTAYARPQRRNNILLNIALYMPVLRNR